VPLSCDYVLVRIDPRGLVALCPLTMITCGCGLEGVEGLRLTDAGGRPPVESRGMGVLGGV
jgi:hypothetical protein